MTVELVSDVSLLDSTFLKHDLFIAVCSKNEMFFLKRDTKY